MASPQDILKSLGIAPVNPGAATGDWISTHGPELISYSPIDGQELARVRTAQRQDLETVLNAATRAWATWRMMPAPQRGGIVREIGLELREHLDNLGALVSLEMGKILPEGRGEVQEMIDVADFAVGLSRQLYGLTMHSERPGHRMYEQWHPLGHIGVISAFNFPVAVWAWNALIAAVCGDCVIWKPSEETPLTAIAVQHICDRVLARHGLKGIFNLVIGSVEDIGEPMLADRRFPLISATGSCRMGRCVGQVVGERLGRTLLELGGNNGIIVMEDADLGLATRAALFGAVGTAGQRCTSLRRLFLHRAIAQPFLERLKAAYAQVKIGNPLEAGTLMGPLINSKAVATMQQGLATIRQQGGEVIYGGQSLQGNYVEPTIIRAPAPLPVMQDEIFAPILYTVEFDHLEQALAWHNDVPQGLSSAMFTSGLIAAETFLSHRGSDCGIANINIGTSGAEIGGAFGGEKDTGGGRESGSDSWKAYMRRQTVTINWSRDLPLAQGIQFG